MRTVGEILKEARETNYYTLEQVEKATKIRKELLEALEKGEYSQLPPATFVQGFIKNYARFLKLDSEKLLAIFRREFQESTTGQVMEAFANPNKKKHFNLTPAKVIGGVVSLVILAFFVYLWVQYHQYVGAPLLKVTAPADQAVVDLTQISVEGVTDPDAVLSINNQQVPLDDKGAFKESINLTGASNKITIVATSKLNQKTVVERTVFVKR